MHQSAFTSYTTFYLPKHNPQQKQVKTERRYCLSVDCFTDEVLVRSVSSHKDVWLLTDELDGNSWLMQAKTPVCPYCGSTLLAPPSRTTALLGT
jgi:hypothetical protein